MWWAWARNSLVACAVVLASCTPKSPRKENIVLLLASSLSPLSEAIRSASLPNAHVDLSFLSSAAIAQQIEQGAPCDGAILASDQWYQHLRDRGLMSGPAVIVAQNKLVLAALASEKKIAQSLEEDLLTAQKIIVADDAHAPLGTYTMQALNRLSLFAELSARLIKAHSARQAVVMLEQGLAERAILFASDAKFSTQIRIAHRISQTLHEPIRYALVACPNSSGQRHALIADVFAKPEVKHALIRFGFVLQ